MEASCPHQGHAVSSLSWSFVQSFSSVSAASTPCDFASFQDSTQNLENKEAMNGEQTELLTSYRTKDALRYFFMKIEGSYLSTFAIILLNGF